MDKMKHLATATKINDRMDCVICKCGAYNTVFHSKEDRIEEINIRDDLKSITAEYPCWKCQTFMQFNYTVNSRNVTHVK